MIFNKNNISLFSIIILGLLSLLRDINIFNVIELIILVLIVYEDEKNKEISINRLLVLGLITITSTYLNDIKINLNVVVFSILIFAIILFISRGGFGLGDVVIGIIFSLKYNSILDYYLFFTISFSLAGIYSLILLSIKKLKVKDYIPFGKFLVLGLYISKLIGGYFWIHL